MAKNHHIPIQFRIFLNAFIILLFTILIVILCVLFAARKNALIQKQNYASDLRSQALQLNILKSAILAYAQENSGLDAGQSGAFTTQLNTAESEFYGILNDFSRLRQIRNNTELLALTDTLKRAYSVQAGNISKLLSYLLQKGTPDSGLTGSLFSITGKSLQIAGQSDNARARILLLELQTLEQQFVYQSDDDGLRQIKNILLQIGEVLTENPEPIDFSGIINEIPSITSVSVAIHNINESIGSVYRNYGLLSDIQSVNLVLDAQIGNIGILLAKTLKKTRFLLSLFFILLVVLLTGLFIYLYLYNSFLRLIRPVKRIVAFTDELKIGGLPEKNISNNSQNYVSDVGENLNILVACLKEKYEILKDLNEGELTRNLTLAGKGDLLGTEMIKLKKYIQESAEEHRAHEEETARRQYINEGLTKFSELSHSGYDSIEKLTDNFIRELTKYLNCLQGGIFLVEEDEESPGLELSSAFAYNRKKYLERRFGYGEGLVGTCALEKKTINLTEIPDDYIMITSGLGDAPPGNILLVPMKLEDEVLGVIEIASLIAFTDYQIEFIEQVADSLASTITSTRISERTSRLLKQSQQQAEEMSEQEEEMRQNMEELKATQEESARREEEFRGIVDALGNSVFMAEFNLSGELIGINDKFLIFLGRTREEVTGKGFKQIIRSRKSETVNEKFLDEVKDGEFAVISDTVKIGKKEYHIQFYFASVLNRDSIPVKILCLGTEIEDQ